MFNKLKQFKDLRDQAKEMQSKLSEESITVKSGSVEITMNGNLDLTNVNVDSESLDPNKKSKIEKDFKDAHADALKKMQRVMAMKMKEMGGLPNIPGLS
ncbi:MAG: nucleoid-associated protein, YbaB/EbfC family [Candidatus Magasanikbacteria bacterium RIFOXYC12_FULL_33_11]|uniref:Nucleoid-associated protein, YbaB/EbfC family n=1 Tax=Candidatus Magasanikbacteria bacterium RIFOXYC12_FULL_33_11 TaxID=1798701 RepID=A0A1F6NMF2_9BACT|nr:MAG: nucleoid-associated protein, YbaB/EbfC family [Candidatus Magasanikbacteria bacterium RIFOXYC12_FULL_33_11]